MQIHNKELVSVRVQVFKKSNNVALEIRKEFQDENLIKEIVRCAMRGQPLIIMPEFSDKLRAINRLIELGVLYEQNGEYYFTF